MNSHVAVARLQRAPDSYAVSFALAAKAGLIDAQLAARLSPSAAMLNVLVHVYLEVDYDLVADAVPLTVEWYGEYVRQVAGVDAGARTRRLDSSDMTPRRDATCLAGAGGR